MSYTTIAGNSSGLNLPCSNLEVTGSIIAALGCPAADQRGVPRPQGPACDIGAVEVQEPG